MISFHPFKNHFSKTGKALEEYLVLNNSASKVALTLILGVSFGLIPLPGVSTIILFIIALLFRLNHVLIQLVNYLVYPLQLALIGPFFMVGN